MKNLIITIIILFNSFGVNAQEIDSANSKIDWKKYLTQKQILEYIESSSTNMKSNTESLPFKNLNYNKVIAYDYEGNEEAFQSITSENGKFIPVIKKQKVLNQKQSDQIVDILTTKKTYGTATAACFNPHMAIVFFRDNEIILKIDICLDCNYLISSEEIPAMIHKKISHESEDYYSVIGFTIYGRKKIKDLAKELEFFYGN